MCSEAVSFFLVLFLALVNVDNRRRCFQQLGMRQIVLDTMTNLCKVAAGTNTLIRYNAHGDAALDDDFASFAYGHFAKITHGDKYACRAKLIQVVVDVVGTDAGKIRDTEADVEGACLDDGIREQTVFIHELE